MGQISSNVHYDLEMDIFSAWWRQPDAVVCVEPVEGIVLRVDANTDEFVGYTVFDCRRRFAGQKPEDMTLPLVPVEALRPLRAHLKVLEAPLAKVA